MVRGQEVVMLDPGCSGGAVEIGLFEECWPVKVASKVVAPRTERKFETGNDWVVRC